MIIKITVLNIMYYIINNCILLLFFQNIMNIYNVIIKNNVVSFDATVHKWINILSVQLYHILLYIIQHNFMELATTNIVIRKNH